MPSEETADASASRGTQKETGGIQEIPRRHPRHTQEAPKGPPGGIKEGPPEVRGSLMSLILK